MNHKQFMCMDVLEQIRRQIPSKQWNMPQENNDM